MGPENLESAAIRALEPGPPIIPNARTNMITVTSLLVVPLATAVATLVAWRSRAAQRWISLAGTFLLLCAAIALVVDVWQEGLRVVTVGAWPAPFGIVLVADHLSAIMVLASSVIALAVIIYSLGSIDPEREALGYHPLFHIQLLGVVGAFLTGDLFNLYVWFEVLLIASFALLGLGAQRAQIRASIKYVVINLVSSLLLLTAVGLLYGLTGTVNMAHLAVRLPELDAGIITALSMLFIAAFGLKAAVFPLFSWLPASYHTPPVAIMALFSGLLTKVGVYALIRVFTLLFTQDVEFTHSVLLVLAGATMVTGVLGALAQEDVRRILSVHIVSQIGYLIMGLALFTALGLAGAIFYTVHVMIVKVNLFLIGGEVRRLGGSFALKQLGGLYKSHGLLALLFAISALSLAGFPPMSGFFAKLMLVLAGLREGQYLIVAVALTVGLLTTLSMLKIWTKAFWRPAEPHENEHGEGEPRGQRGYPFLRLAPIATLTALTLAMGLWAHPLMDLAGRAAAELMNPQSYVDAVLAAGERAW
jgi:multicomponent Na+:H+ antiporter subunit D